MSLDLLGNPPLISSGRESLGTLIALDSPVRQAVTQLKIMALFQAFLARACAMGRENTLRASSSASRGAFKPSSPHLTLYSSSHNLHTPLEHTK